MGRPSKAETFMRLAYGIAEQSTCVRRNVGCILVDERHHVLSTGVNGVPDGFPHCNEGHPCVGAEAASGEQLGECWAVHAEQNALLQCSDVYRIDRAYLTVSPCIHCIKLLLNTSCQHLVFGEVYSRDPLNLWANSGRTWELCFSEYSETDSKWVKYRKD